MKLPRNAIIEVPENRVSSSLLASLKRQRSKAHFHRTERQTPCRVSDTAWCPGAREATRRHLTRPRGQRVCAPPDTRPQLCSSGPAGRRGPGKGGASPTAARRCGRSGPGRPRTCEDAGPEEPSCREQATGTAQSARRRPRASHSENTDGVSPTRGVTERSCASPDALHAAASSRARRPDPRPRRRRA